MRWIEPGRFLMGSPEIEASRYADELQHEVTLTQGYWLAETACSQGLWAAVTGERPSHFEGDDLPVELVSWNECVKFCEELTSRLPGELTIRLPTEAEWEYACRAGTNTVFNFGNDLSTEQANFDGNHPYAEGEKGEYRKGTLPVDAFAPNDWGLYQMHGNVYEWCTDRFGEYEADPVRDPRGAKGGSDRVLRGGSWLYYGRTLRSAYRSHYAPDSRNRNTGLRLAGGIDPQASRLTADRRPRGPSAAGTSASGSTATKPAGSK
ncbi:MAG: formylglycine-generating enzyme family protein [Gammaproteobacteria bacterium]|nr:formylglycine-generating enzyme family protein [Gammaproteobacteria bacterium]